MVAHVKTLPSAHSVETTIARLERALTERHGVPPEVAAPLAKVDALLEAAAGGPA